MTAAMEKECKMDGIPSEQSITGCKAVSRQFLKTKKFLDVERKAEISISSSLRNNVLCRFMNDD